MAKQTPEKHDTRRRRRDPEKAAFWRSIVKEQAASGLGVRAFCRDRGLAEASFYHWRRELRRRRLEGKRFREEATSRIADARDRGAATNAAGQPPRRSAAPAPAAKEGNTRAGGTSRRTIDDRRGECVRPAFAEVRLPERPDPMPEIEIRRGEVSVFLRGGRDSDLLREALTLMGGAPC